MNVIGRRRLLELGAAHKDALPALKLWFKAAARAEWRRLEDIRRTFPATDMVGDLAIFDIRGNRYRLIVRMVFGYQRIYVKELLRHADFDKGRWKKWL